MPKTLVKHMIEWYHENLQHAGVTRTQKTMAKYFTWKKMKEEIEDFIKTCDICQRFKITRVKNYGKILENTPLHQREIWEVVHLDCMG